MLFDFYDLHHVRRAFTSWIACGNDDQLTLLDTIVLGEKRSKVVIVC